jgi:hypothetical protein
VRPDLLVDQLADGTPELFVLGIEEMRPPRSYRCQ